MIGIADRAFRGFNRRDRVLANDTVIILSGSTDAEMPQKLKTLGADEFLRKPVDQGALFAALDKVLPGR